MQLRRAFGTIHEAHCIDGWDVASVYEYLKHHLPAMAGYESGAVALELTENDNLHIQLYFECSPKRLSTMKHDFLTRHETCFEIVKDAEGSWAYCTGTGAHENKPALDRFEFGTPKLYGGTARADLKSLVDLVISGASLAEIMKGNPIHIVFIVVEFASFGLIGMAKEY